MNMLTISIINDSYEYEYVRVPLSDNPEDYNWMIIMNRLEKMDIPAESLNTIYSCFEREQLPDIMSEYKDVTLLNQYKPGNWIGYSLTSQ